MRPNYYWCKTKNFVSAFWLWPIAALIPIVMILLLAFAIGSCVKTIKTEGLKNILNDIWEGNH